MRHYQASLDPLLHSHYGERWTDKHTRSSAPVHLLLHCRSWGMGLINTYTQKKVCQMAVYEYHLQIFYSFKFVLLFCGLLDPIWQMSKLVWRIKDIINNNLSLVQHSRWSTNQVWSVFSHFLWTFSSLGPLKSLLFNTYLERLSNHRIVQSVVIKHKYLYKYLLCLHWCHHLFFKCGWKCAECIWNVHIFIFIHIFISFLRFMRFSESQIVDLTSLSASL